MEIDHFLKSEGLSIDENLLDDLRDIKKYVQDNQNCIFKKLAYFMKSYKRNSFVLVCYQDSAVTIRKKFKEVEDDIKYGKCYVQDGSLFDINNKYSDIVE